MDQIIKAIWWRNVAVLESHAKSIFPDQNIGLKPELVQCNTKPKYNKSQDFLAGPTAQLRLRLLHREKQLSGIGEGGKYTELTKF